MKNARLWTIYEFSHSTLPKIFLRYQHNSQFPTQLVSIFPFVRSVSVVVYVSEKPYLRTSFGRLYDIVVPNSTFRITSFHL